MMNPDEMLAHISEIGEDAGSDLNDGDEVAGKLGFTIAPRMVGRDPILHGRYERALEEDEDRQCNGDYAWPVNHAWRLVLIDSTDPYRYWRVDNGQVYRTVPKKNQPGEHIHFMQDAQGKRWGISTYSLDRFRDLGFRVWEISNPSL